MTSYALRDQPHGVYRLYDTAGDLLYVGMSINPAVRILSHCIRDWYREIDKTRTRIEEFGDFDEAHRAEIQAIRSEVPRHNRERYVRGHGKPMRPLNIYRSDADQEVWERADREAKAANCSLASHIVAVLRADQERSDRIADEAGWSSAQGPVVS